VCLGRCTRARVTGRITLPDFASIIDDGLAAAGGVGFILDPEVTR
jgi:hypothetical protein